MSFLLRVVLAIGLGRIIARRRKPGAKESPLDRDSQPWFDWTNDLKFEWYMQRRNGYSAGARDSYSRYDQTIAGVSAGAIVLSVTFLKDLDYAPESLRLLYASWIVFLIAGGSSLYSLRTSADHDIEQLTQLEKLRKTGKLDSTRATQLGKKTVRLNRVSLGSFVLGIFLIIAFAFANYSVLEEKKWQKENTAQAALAPQAPSAANEIQRKPSAAAPALPESTSPKASPATPSTPQENPSPSNVLRKSEERMATERPTPPRPPERPPEAPRPPQRPPDPPRPPITPDRPDHEIRTPPAPSPGYPGEGLDP